MKGTLRAVALVVLIASAGAIAGLAVGAIMGMSFGDLAHLAVPIAVSTVVTVGTAITANAALRKTSLRYRFVVVAVLGAGIALANLAVMARLMLVSDHDIAIVMLLVVFGAGTAVALAMVLASSSTKAVDRLVEGAGRIGDGDLGTRIGRSERRTRAGRARGLAGRRRGSTPRGPRVGDPGRADAPRPDRGRLARPADAARQLAGDGRSDRRRGRAGSIDGSSLRREMRRSVEQLVTMVDDLFELTQLDAGAIRAETTRASLDDVVRSALAAIEPTAQLKGVEMVADLGAAAGATCSPRLVRVLQNLLVNAVRHTPSDGTIRIEAVSGDSVLTVAVEDTGKGSPRPTWNGCSSRSSAPTALGAGREPDWASRSHSGS